MRNLNKWVKENGGTIVEREYSNKYEVKGIKFTVRRKESDCYTSWDGRRYGSSAGYTLRIEGKNYSHDYKTQKDVISEVEALIVKQDNKIEEVEALNETQENVIVSQSITGNYFIKNIETQEKELLMIVGGKYTVLRKGKEFAFEDVKDAIHFILVEIGIIKVEVLETKPEIKVFEEIGSEAKHIDTKVIDGREIKKWAVLDDPMDRRIFTHNGKMIATFRTWPQFEEWYYGQKRLSYYGGW